MSTKNSETFGIYMPMGQLISERMPTFTIGITSEGGSHTAATRDGSKVIPIEAGDLYEAGVRVDAKVAIGSLTPSPNARDVVE